MSLNRECTVSSKNSVKPINIPSISSRLSESIEAIHTSRIDEPQDTFELQAVQSHSKIINVAPIHLEEQRVESLENIDMIQSIDLAIENSEFNKTDVENPESQETPEVPDQKVFFNNQKFNQSLIGFAGLTLLFVIIFTVGPFFDWHFRFADNFESIVFKVHLYYCLPIILPTVYFMMNPKHLIMAMRNFPYN